MRKLVVAGAMLATLLALPPGLLAVTPSAHPETAPTDADRATEALGYLLAAQKGDGSIDDSIGETADFVIGTAAAGYDPSTLTGCSGGASALGYLAAASDAAAADAAKTGKTVLAVVAAASDPTSFDGRNLLARLAALYHSTAGAYGDGSTFSQSFAILALVASGGFVPAAASAHLVALQDSDGSWSYGSAPVAAGGGDTNSTAIALMALDAAGVHSADGAGLAYLHTQQRADGGFPYSSAYGPSADPDSDSIVLQALVAAGQDPESPAWLQGSNGVLTNLRAYQGADGGFAYPGNKGEDAFTTSQVPAALMRVPYAATVHPRPGSSVPTSGCRSQNPSPSGASGSGKLPVATANPGGSLPPTSTAPDSSQRPGPAPLFVPLTCLAFGGLGLAVLEVRRRGAGHGRRPGLDVGAGGSQAQSSGPRRR
ncbi:MAG: prenyltransferase/squalene oxidase repeat-containing protein [Candidatus Limnocylindrales bacterium]|jgi:hypothetical protein